MAVVRPFRAVRPAPDKAAQVASLPYDVMNTAEAREYVKGNPYSFMRIDRAEVNLPESADPYAQSTYETAANLLTEQRRAGVYIKDDKPCFYVYKQVMDGRAQIGVVGCASVDDYLSNVVKKHELTLAKKEDDRCNHVDFLDANPGPIFLTYQARPEIDAAVARAMEKAPVYDFVGGNNVQQTCWIIDGDADIAVIGKAFAETPALYIADGHHRAASAVRVARKRRCQNPDYTGSEEFNFFLCVLFPDNQLKILDYNRVVMDLNGLTEAAFEKKISEKFDLRPLDGAPHDLPKHTFGMFLGGKWQKLIARAGTYDTEDVVASLDVSILQQNLLTPILGIGDPRTDKRIDFVGGIRGLGELEKRVREGAAVAFAMCPTSISELMSIANAGLIMPPKSTWFEPKLLSGLFIHDLK